MDFDKADTGDDLQPLKTGSRIVSLGQTWDSFFLDYPTVSDDFLHADGSDVFLFDLIQLQGQL